MKKLVLSAMIIALTAGVSYAQKDSEKSLVERITKMETKSDAVKVKLMMRAGLNCELNGSKESVGFKLEDFRLDVQGNISKNVYYWYRQSLNRSFDGAGTRENAPSSLNVAAIGVRLGKFDILTGRQFVAYGGYEYDYAPMDVYEYSQIMNFSSPYHTGVNLSYSPSTTQQIRFQVTNSYNNSFEKAFGNVPLHIEKATVPLQYTLNWNASFFGGKYNTRWSATCATVGRGQENYFYALGNELNFGKFNAYADFYFSQEDLDSRTMMTTFNHSANKADDLSALGAQYLGVVARINYSINPKWKLIFKWMYDSAAVTEDNHALKEGTYSNTFGGMGGVEYSPFDTPLRFYANYVMRSYQFTELATKLGFEKHHTDRISIGLVYRLPVF